MTELFKKCRLSHRIEFSLDAGLRRESNLSGDHLSKVVRDCLYLGLEQREKLRKRKPPLDPARAS